MVEFAVFLLEEALIKVVGSLDQVKLEMTEVRPSSSSAVPSIWHSQANTRHLPY